MSIKVLTKIEVQGGMCVRVCVEIFLNLSLNLIC